MTMLQEAALAALAHRVATFWKRRRIMIWIMLWLIVTLIALGFMYALTK
jgi:hypothetical protein